jgi:hypothetical protein
MRLASRLLRFGGVPLGVVLAMVVAVGHATYAAYVATTANNGSSYAAGSVVVTDNDGGTTYSFPSLAFGQTKTWCTTVTYGGSLTADVRTLATAGGTIPGSISVSVDVGSGGDAACTGFTLTSNLYTGTLAGLAAAAPTWATGLGGFTGANSGDARTYRFKASLNDPAAPDGSTATATITWEAHSQ